MNFNSKIGIGTVQFGMDYGISNRTGQVTSDEVFSILKTAHELGVNLLDTSIGYGNSENELGKNDCSKFKIVSKYLDSKTYGSISSQIKTSLSHLKVTKIYGYLAHNPKSLIENPNEWEELLNLKKNGIVQKIGYSLYTNSELELLLSLNMFPDIIQVPFNYFDNRFEDNLLFLKSKGCEIHTRSTFLQGLFFLQKHELGVFFDEVISKILNLQTSNTLSGDLLKHVIEKDYIDFVIIGVQNTKQLIENLNSLKFAKKLPLLNEHISEKILNPALWPQK